MSKRKSKPKYIGCTIRELPDHEQIAAAKFACSVNPVNAPKPASFGGLSFDRFAIAVQTTKFFGAAGVHLTVGFVEPTAAALADKILSHMNAWGQFCNASFTMGTGSWTNAQVRISRGGGGYWSYLGTDVLQIPRNEPTMNLQGFILTTSESEYKRVVRHETGHTLGCIHEHMRREIVARLDPAKTTSYFEQTQGWSAQEIQQQVLTPIEETSLMHTLHAEVDSVMCYALPASITTDGKPIPGGLDITPSDGAFMGTLYPLAVAPPPNPPPQPPGPARPRIVVLEPGTYEKVAL